MEVSHCETGGPRSGQVRHAEGGGATAGVAVGAAGSAVSRRMHAVTIARRGEGMLLVAVQRPSHQHAEGLSRGCLSQCAMAGPEDRSGDGLGEGPRIGLDALIRKRNTWPQPLAKHPMLPAPPAPSNRVREGGGTGL